MLTGYKPNGIRVRKRAIAVVIFIQSDQPPDRGASPARYGSCRIRIPDHAAQTVAHEPTHDRAIAAGNRADGIALVDRPDIVFASANADFPVAVGPTIGSASPWVPS